MKNLDIATCSYSAYRRPMGVPIITSLGTPKWWEDARIVAKSVQPFGVFGKYTGFIEYRTAYEDRLNSLRHKLEAEFNELGQNYPQQTLVMLCFCDVRKPDGWCHRTMAAKWLEANFGLVVPELTLTIKPQRPAPLPPLSLFD